MLAARYQLVSLWFSQTARCLADGCLGAALVLLITQLGPEPSPADWLGPFALFLAPRVLLAPVNGALSNSLPKRAVLVGSALFGLCTTALFAAVAGGQVHPWLCGIGLGLMGTRQAIYSVARDALLPAAAQDVGVPLSRILGWLEAGCASASAAGILLGQYLHPVAWPEAFAVRGGQSSLAPVVQRWHLSVAVAASLGFDLLAVLAALGVHFPSDVRRPESAARALAGFFRDSKVILQDGTARRSLLGLACFLGLLTAGSLASWPTLGVAMPLVPPHTVGQAGADQALLLVSLGAAGGSLLAGIQGHPRRVLGLVPPAAWGLVATLVWSAAGSYLTWVYLLLGLMGGLVHVPLRTVFQLALPAEARGNGMALMSAANDLSVGSAALLVFGLPRLGIMMPPGQLWLLAGLATIAALVAGRALLRETIEQLGEMVLWPMYRVRVRGPGVGQIPPRGPLLVIANHTAWFDPLWLAKMLPRCVTPLMTSRFFDLPILHWLMSNVAGAIRVEEATYRREAPELQEAVAVLDRGGCVLIFPEGAMKRRPEQALRHFGQGVWRILRQRPQTPVVACWIEGGWGSFASYYGGPPAVNKHLDWWRPIAIGIEAPQVLDPALLADQHATRDYLMRACLGARRYLGLQPLPLPSGAAKQPDSNAQYERA